MLNTESNSLLWNYYFLNACLITRLNDTILNIKPQEKLIQDPAEQAIEAVCIHYSSNDPV